LERELVEAARRGDRAAYDAVVRRKVESVYRTARAILGNEADAEDATQEAFLAAWRFLPRLRDPERFEAWFARILVNACRARLRTRRGIREIQIDMQREDRTRPDPRSYARPDAGQLADQIVEATAFDAAFERLSIEDRSILTLHHLDDLGLREVAAILGIPTGTAKSRLLRARRALRRSLEREEPT
jgi:RNA polymerase sigma-70 factor (ECF subfamily)